MSDGENDDEEPIDVTYTEGTADGADPDPLEDGTDRDGHDGEGSGTPSDPGSEDPFERLASEIDGEVALGDDGDGTGEGGPGLDEGAFSIGSDEPGSSPFDELDADVEDVDLDELFEERFTEAETGDLDSGTVWEQLDEGDTDAGETDADEHVVSAREFCAQCEHAAEPPEIRCTYEGSEIVEFADNDAVRVRNCPIVAQRRRVGEMD